MVIVVNIIVFTLVYLTIIGLTIIIQVFANWLMRSTADFFQCKKFPFRNGVLLLILMYIQIFAIIADILIWSAVVMWAGIFTDFIDAFTFATDSFTTLGNGGNIASPWEYIGPVMAVNGIVVIAFAVTSLYDILHFKVFKEPLCLYKDDSTDCCSETIND